MKFFEQDRTLSNGRQVLFHEFNNTSADLYEQSTKLLVVSFNPMPPILDVLKPGWGFDYFFQLNVSVLNFKAKINDWYRGDDVINFFQSNYWKALSSSYEKIIFTGVSMGGYAALAYSAAAPGSIVIAHCPQSTLNREKVPWETRFGISLHQDWQGAFHDGNDGVKKSSKTYITYDPFLRLDKLHIERLHSDNLVKLKTNFFGHAVPESLNKIGLLKRIFEKVAIEEQVLSEHEFFEWIKLRRNVDRYYVMLSKRLKTQECRLSLFSSAKIRNPTCGIYSFYISRILLMEYQSHLEALNEINIALSLDKADYRFYTLKSNILKALERYDESLECIQSAIQLEPENLRNHYLMSLLFQKQGKYEQAKLCLVELLKKSASCLKYITSLAQLNIKASDYEEAIEIIDRGLELEPVNDELLFLKARVFEIQKKYKDSFYLFEALSDKNPENPFYSFKAGLNQLRAFNDVDKALQFIDKSVCLAPENEIYRNKLNQLLSQKKRT